MSGMAPKRGAGKQQQLNVDQFTLFKKPMEHLGKQINVPCSFWEGRMLVEESETCYKCTIVDFSLARKFAPDASPMQAFFMQEMGINGMGSHEKSDLDDDNDDDDDDDVLYLFLQKQRIGAKLYIP